MVKVDVSGFRSGEEALNVSCFHGLWVISVLIKQLYGETLMVEVDVSGLRSGEEASMFVSLRSNRLQ